MSYTTKQMAELIVSKMSNQEFKHFLQMIEAPDEILDAFEEIGQKKFPNLYVDPDSEELSNHL